MGMSLPRLCGNLKLANNNHTLLWENQNKLQALNPKKRHSSFYGSSVLAFFYPGILGAVANSQQPLYYLWLPFHSSKY